MVSSQWSAILASIAVKPDQVVSVKRLKSVLMCVM
jgi:hypothetical protein